MPARYQRQALSHGAPAIFVVISSCTKLNRVPNCGLVVSQTPNGWGGVAARFDLSEKTWEIALLLPDKPHGVPRTDDRRALSGIFHILQTGSPCRDLPDRYGPSPVAYNRLKRCAKGAWLRISTIAPSHAPQRLMETAKVAAWA